MNKLIRFPALALLLVLASTAQAQVDEILVRAKNFTITKQDFDAEIAKIPEADRPLLLNNQKRINDILANMVINRGIYEDAKRKGLDKEPLIARELQIAQERALAFVMLDRVGREAPHGNLEVAAREIYRAEPERFTKGLLIQPAHILITTRTRNAADARKLADDIRIMARNNVKPFEELALQYSEDPSVKDNKGDLGKLQPSRLVKAFADAALKLAKPGDVSDVVETDFGFHVIKLLSREGGQLLPFEEVQDGLIEELKTTLARKAKNAYTEEIVKAAAADANTEAVARLHKPLNFDALLKAEQAKQAAEAAQKRQPGRAK